VPKFYDFVLIISLLGASLSQNIWMMLIQFLGCVLIALWATFIIILWPYSRRKLRECRFAGFYEKHLHSFVLARQILLFFFPIAVLMALSPVVPIKLEYFLGSVVFGLSTVIFVSIQLPLLMKAHLRVSFRIDDGKWVKTINLRAGETHKVEFAIENLGFSTYKNFSIIFYFGPKFEVLPPSHPKYMRKHLDFKKEFSIQQQHGGAMFSPKENFLTIPPQEVFIFPIFIKAPKKEDKYPLTIQFFAENTWGMNRISIPITVYR